MAKTIKFTKGEMNLMAKHGLTKYGDPLDPTKAFVRSNPFSGVEVPVNMFAANLIDTLISMYHDYNYHPEKFKVGEYDRLKYLLLKVDSEAYMNIID